MLTLVTSFYPGDRVKEQLRAYRSWLSLKLPIVAVQLERDISFVSDTFPKVKIHATDKSGKEFGLIDSPRVISLIDQAKDKDILIINSDIIIAKVTPADFLKKWLPHPETMFKVGIRTEVPQGHKLPSGIDVFRVTTMQYPIFKDIGYSLGSDTWDYWMVWTALTNGLSIKTVDIQLLHPSHKPGRSDTIKQRSREIFKQQQNVDMHQLKKVVQALTDRAHLIK